jgi:hypothetical protein
MYIRYLRKISEKREMTIGYWGRIPNS